MAAPSLIFSRRLKELRLSNGLSQADLAEQLHTIATTISRYEAGTREPNLETIALIADLFNVDFNYLLGKSNTHPRLYEDNLILIHKFQMLDDRGKAAVLNVLEHEYSFTKEK